MHLAGQLDLIIFFGMSLVASGVVQCAMLRSVLRRGVSNYIWVIMWCIWIVGCWGVNLAGETERAHLRRQVEGFAPTYAREMERMGHERVTLKTDPNDPSYLTMIEAEKRWLRANPAISDIYTYRLLPDNQVALLVDSETDYDHNGRFEGERETRTAIGEIWGVADEHLLLAFSGHPAFEDVPYKDRWGTWVSAYEPLHDANGNVEGILGVDYPAQDWVTQIRKTRLSVIGLLTLLELATLIPHVFLVILQVDVNRRKQMETALRESEERFKGLADHAPVLIWMTNEEGGFVYLNDMWSFLLGIERESLLGMKWLEAIHPEDRTELFGRVTSCTTPPTRFSFEHRLQRQDGEYRWILCTGAPRIDVKGRFQGYIGTGLDVTQRRQLLDQMARTQQQLEEAVKQRTAELLETERHLMQNEKLASVGQLAAGIAHEINTPIQYVGDNLRALQDFFNDLCELIGQYQSVVEAARSDAPVSPGIVEGIDAAEKECDLAFIQQDAPLAISQALEGVQRVAHIVRAMKDFSHVQREERTAADLNHCINSTLTVARNEYKYLADVVTDLGDIPAVECFASEINQVFLNMIVNAAHAIADTQQRGTITIRTRCVDDAHVEVSISDTGTGIPPEVQGKIFDPFFTTKEVGKGTGQGLNIAHQVVVQQHQGTLTFETTVGKGTTFIIQLPVHAAQEQPAGQVEAENETHLVCG